MIHDSHLADAAVRNQAERQLRLEVAARKLREPRRVWLLLAARVILIPLLIGASVAWSALPAAGAFTFFLFGYSLCILGIEALLIRQRQDLLVELVLASRS
jgi:hypothetical protein